MTMKTHDATANGRQRKTLAHQLDRLDAVLDGLGDGLNAAIADAVRAAVREAVQAAVAEVLASPAISVRLQTVAAPVVTPPPQNNVDMPKVTVAARLGALWAGVRAKVTAFARACMTCTCAVGSACNRAFLRVLAYCGGCLQSCRAAVGKGIARGRSRLAALGTTCRQLLWFKDQVLVALGVGVVAAVAVYYAGPWLAAAVSGAASFAMTLAVQAGCWLRRAWGLSRVPLGSAGVWDGTTQ
jgi:hypothetical protein